MRNANYQRTIYVYCILIAWICSATTCDCYESTPEYIESTLKSISLYNINNEGEEPVVATISGVKKEAYILCIRVECENIDPLVNETQYYMLANGIQNIRIYTLTSFNENYPAGSDVSECFKPYPILLNNHLYDLTLYGTPIKRLNDRGNTLYKALRTIPDPGAYQFRVEAELEDGQTIEQETEIVILY